MFDEIIMYHRRAADDTRAKLNQTERSQTVVRISLRSLAAWHDKAADYLIDAQRSINAMRENPSL